MTTLSAQWPSPTAARGAEEGLLAALPSLGVSAAINGSAAGPEGSTLRKVLLPTDATPKVSPPSRSTARPAASAQSLDRVLATRWETYSEQLRRCREAFSEEAVHELRVATRRLLAQFVLLECVAASASLEKARRSLKRRLSELGALRDTQVQLAFFRQHAERYPGLQPLLRWMEQRERRLIKSAALAVRNSGTRKLGKRLKLLQDALAEASARPQRQRRLAAAALQATTLAYRDVVKRRKAIDISDVRTVHQTRVAFKRFRYLVESLSPDLTGLTRRRLRKLAYYQRRMGIIQDLEVIQRGLAEFVSEKRHQENALREFRRYLAQRRMRALKRFLSSADAVLGFWPPAQLHAGSGSGTKLAEAEAA